MRLKGILNRDGGTFKTTDMEAFCSLATDVFEHNNHTFECTIVNGSDVSDALQQVAGDDDFDGVIVGGGDGTISLATGSLKGTNKVLGVLPAGTMNLFSRSLGLSQNVEQALRELAAGKLAKVDVPTMNGRPFIHQFSAGLHAAMIKNRDRLDYQSRLGKISASTRAWFDVLRMVPEFELSYQTPEVSGDGAFSMALIANNRIDANMLPFTDRPSGGVLGVYLVKALAGETVTGIALDILSGQLQESEAVIRLEAPEITLKFGNKASDQALDGDMIDPEMNVVIKQNPGVLSVIVPAGSQLN